MIPRPSLALTDLAVRLATKVAPNTTETFYAADAGLIAQLMLTLAQEYERGVETRMNDIDEMRTLLRSAPPSDDIDAFLALAPISLALADVNAVHDTGTRLLIDVHAWAEVHDEPLSLQIWRYLRRHCERHKFELP